MGFPENSQSFYNLAQFHPALRPFFPLLYCPSHKICCESYSNEFDNAMYSLVIARISDFWQLGILFTNQLEVLIIERENGLVSKKLGEKHVLLRRLIGLHQFDFVNKL